MRTTCLASSLSPSSSPAAGKAWGCGALDRDWPNPVEKTREEVTEKGSGRVRTESDDIQEGSTEHILCVAGSTQPPATCLVLDTVLKALHSHSALCTDTVIPDAHLLNTYILIGKQLLPQISPHGLSLGLSTVIKNPEHYSWLYPSHLPSSPFQLQSFV